MVRTRGTDELVSDSDQRAQRGRESPNALESQRIKNHGLAACRCRCRLSTRTGRRERPLITPAPGRVDHAATEPVRAGLRRLGFRVGAGRSLRTTRTRCRACGSSTRAGSSAAGRRRRTDGGGGPGQRHGHAESVTAHCRRPTRRARDLGRDWLVTAPARAAAAAAWSESAGYRSAQVSAVGRRARTAARRRPAGESQL